MKYHYVYIITHKETGKKYIGSRSSKLEPIKDIGKKYFSSSSNKDFIKDQKNNPQNYLYEVYGQYPDRITVNEVECELHKQYDVGYNEEYINNATAYTPYFCTAGKITVKDKNGNFFQVNQDDPLFLSGELTHISKGTVTVKDKKGTIFRVNTNDPRYLSGELRQFTKGTTVVKDKDGNMFRVNTNDPRYLSGELTHVTKGTVTVKDKDGNIFKVDIKDPRILSGELVGFAKGKIWLTNGKDNKLCYPEDAEQYLSNGYWKGKTNYKK
jgi:hypothetical protein